MKIFINHCEKQAEEGATVLDVLAREGLAGEGVAVAVDNKVLPRAGWGDVKLAEGMRLTVIRAVCGG